MSVSSISRDNKDIFAVKVWRSWRQQSVASQSLIASSMVSFHTFFISLLPLYLNPVSVFIFLNLKANAMSLLINRSRGFVLPPRPMFALQDAVFPISVEVNKCVPVFCSPKDVVTSEVFHPLFRVFGNKLSIKVVTNLHNEYKLYNHCRFGW